MANPSFLEKIDLYNRISDALEGIPGVEIRLELEGPGSGIKIMCHDLRQRTRIFTAIQAVMTGGGIHG
jgi:hypothetical protein